MQPETAKSIRIVLALIILIALTASNIFLFTKVRGHEAVINAQGSLLKLMVETPEIKGVLVQYIQRMQGVGTTTKQ